MSRLETNCKSRHSLAIPGNRANAGACTTVALISLLISSEIFAQQPPSTGEPPVGGPIGSPAGAGTSISNDPKLLSPLPPPSAEIMKRNPPSPDPRNLEGIWLADAQPFPGTVAMPQLPLTEAAKQHIADTTKRQQAAAAQGKVLLTQSARCRPMEGIGLGSELFPAEVIQTPDKITILNEEGRGRWVIHMNGQHPKNVALSYFGHSVGHWEGDTLVVDTVGMHASEGAFGKGLRSDKARVVSRLHKFDGGRAMELSSTIYDPETYTQPYEQPKTVSRWHPELSLLEFQCEENTEGAREGMVE